MLGDLVITGSLGGVGLSGTEELGRPHLEGFRLARNEDLLLLGFSLPAIPSPSYHALITTHFDHHLVK